MLAPGYVLQIALELGVGLTWLVDFGFYGFLAAREVSLVVAVLSGIMWYDPNLMVRVVFEI